MLQLLWNMFEETGRINTYMFYKALEQEDRVSKTETAIPGVPGGKPAIGPSGGMDGRA